MAYRVTKTWGHEQGLSVCLRNWRADHSHCHFMHGYALSIGITFEARELDRHGWVIDFGSLKEIKAMLAFVFDHKTLIADDDPHLPWFRNGEALGVLELTVLPAVGCEQFAAWVLGEVQRWLIHNDAYPRVRVVQVDVSEHGANKATVTA